MAATRRSAALSAMAVDTDPMWLTLRCSAELTRQRRGERLLAEVAALRRQNAALQQRRASLAARLAELPADGQQQQQQHASFSTLGSQAVWRHLGVWVAVSRPAGASCRQTVVRLQPDDSQPAHTLQLQSEPRSGGGGGGDRPLTASVRDLPPGVRLEAHLEQLGTQRQMPELVHALASEVDAFSSRRRQVAELREALPSRRTRVEHDPAVCDVRLQLQLRAKGHRTRTHVQFNMLYAPDAVLPYECRIGEADHLNAEDAEELAETSRVFLHLPLRQAFAEAFQ